MDLINVPFQAAWGVGAFGLLAPLLGWAASTTPWAEDLARIEKVVPAVAAAGTRYDARQMGALAANEGHLAAA